MIKNPKGLILIELIMTIVLIGIIATFTGFFIYSGINSYLRAKHITNGAWMPRGRWTAFLWSCETSPIYTPHRAATSVTYKSATLTGTRTLKYDGNTIFISTNPNDYELLENVSSFNLSYTDLNLDNDAAPVDEVANIEVDI